MYCLSISDHISKVNKTGIERHIQTLYKHIDYFFQKIKEGNNKNDSTDGLIALVRRAIHKSKEELKENPEKINPHKKIIDGFYNQASKILKENKVSQKSTIFKKFQEKKNDLCEKICSSNPKDFLLIDNAFQQILWTLYCDTTPYLTTAPTLQDLIWRAIDELLQTFISKYEQGIQDTQNRPDMTYDYLKKFFKIFHERRLSEIIFNEDASPQLLDLFFENYQSFHSFKSISSNDKFGEFFEEYKNVMKEYWKKYYPAYVISNENTSQITNIVMKLYNLYFHTLSHVKFSFRKYETNDTEIGIPSFEKFETLTFKNEDVKTPENQEQAKKNETAEKTNVNLSQSEINNDNDNHLKEVVPEVEKNTPIQNKIFIRQRIGNKYAFLPIEDSYEKKLLEMLKQPERPPTDQVAFISNFQKSKLMTDDKSQVITNENGFPLIQHQRYDHVYLNGGFYFILKETHHYWMQTLKNMSLLYGVIEKNDQQALAPIQGKQRYQLLIKINNPSSPMKFFGNFRFPDGIYTYVCIDKRFLFIKNNNANDHAQNIENAGDMYGWTKISSKKGGKDNQESSSPIETRFFYQNLQDKHLFLPISDEKSRVLSKILDETAMGKSKNAIQYLGSLSKNLIMKNEIGQILKSVKGIPYAQHRTYDQYFLNGAFYFALREEKIVEMKNFIYVNPIFELIDTKTQPLLTPISIEKQYALSILFSQSKNHWQYLGCLSTFEQPVNDNRNDFNSHGVYAHVYIDEGSYFIPMKVYECLVADKR